jgi:23S rRNA pseudouridine2605 synthase
VVVERLQKVLAAAGAGSRRACEDLIRAGRVTVDGEPAALGSSVDPERQTVEVDGRPVAREPLEYWLLNKPAGVVSTVTDTHGRPTVRAMIPSAARLFPVGRLDQDSTGVLILTNDGELANRLTHPRHGVEKEYLVRAGGWVLDEQIRRLREGVRLDEGRTSPARVEVVAAGEAWTELRVVLHQGWKRQVRRMLESVGHPVLSLHRMRVATVSDAGLPPGEARPLTEGEVRDLRRSAGL